MALAISTLLWMQATALFALIVDGIVQIDIGASVACSGVCLTVVARDTNSFDVTYRRKHWP